MTNPPIPDTIEEAIAENLRIKPSDFLVPRFGAPIYLDQLVNNQISPDIIEAKDIAHALAYQCRWSGATPYFYSVAQHSLAVALHTRLTLKGTVTHVELTRACLWALLHDAAEAYMGDMMRPLRVMCPELDSVEEALTHLIQRQFFPPTIMPTLDDIAIVQRSDDEVAAREARLFFYEKRALKAVFDGVEPTSIECGNFHQKDPAEVAEKLHNQIHAMSYYLFQVAEKSAENAEERE